MNRIVVIPERCKGCRSCERACALEHSPDRGSAGPEMAEAALPRIRVQYGPAGGSGRRGRPLPLRCQHCDEPKCVIACMAGALSKGEDGTVRHDPKKCVGCWMCIMSCHYGAISRDPVTKLAVKCDMCPGREVPACVEACKFDAIVIQRNSVSAAPAREEGAVEG